MDTLNTSEIRFVRKLMNCGLDCDKISFLSSLNTWASYRVLIAIVCFIVSGAAMFWWGLVGRKNAIRESGLSNKASENQTSDSGLMMLGALLVALGVFIYQNKENHLIKSVFLVGE